MILDLTKLPAAWVAERVDALFVDRVLAPSKPPAPEVFARQIARMREVAAVYPTVEAEAASEGGVGSFFTRPAAIPAEREEVMGRGLRWRVVDLRWTSDYAVHDEAAAEAYFATPGARQAIARWCRQPSDPPRPTIIAIHGYLGGKLDMEQRLWPISMLRREGFDVVLFTMPHHGDRLGGLERPLFPGRDPAMTIEGVRHAIHDLRTLMGILRRRGVEQIGVMGMSLGGFVAALLTTLEPELMLSIPFIPLASFADWGEDAQTIPRDAALAAEYVEALSAVERLISPVARPSAIASGQGRVVAGRADRVTPLRHARKLAHHFGVPLMTFPGGHLVQVGRASVLQDALRAARAPEGV